VALSKKAQGAIDNVVAKFQAGDLSPIVAIARTQLDPASPAGRWSFSNKVLAYSQTGTLECRGYRQWGKAGRQVKKGSRAAFILGPRMVKVEDKETGEDKMVLRGWVGIPVFGLADTEGDPIPGYEPRELPPLMEVAERLDLAVTWGPMAEALGNCTTEGTKVTVGTHDAAVFFHELAHAIHARLNGRLRGGQHEDQEVLAEFCACVLMHLYGHEDRSGNAWRYIAGYSDKPLVAIQRALADVALIVEWIEGADGAPSA
jgi:hypothetical protein